MWALECEFMAKTWLYLLLRLSRASFKEFGYVGLGPYTLGTIGCHKNRSEPLGQDETLPWTRWCNKLQLHYLHCPSEWVSFPERLATTVVPLKLLVSNFQKVFHKISVVQLLSRVRLFATPWTTAHQASLSFTVFQTLLQLMSFESMKLSSHL